MIKKTQLYPAHLASNARMIDFHGFNMPLHYGSQLHEHQVVRQQAGVFDVSHMAIVDVLGAGGRQFLRHLLTNDVDKLRPIGRALYSCMCNEHGGIIDDLIVYQRAPDNYRLVLNAAVRESDLIWIRNKIHGFSAGLQERTDLSMLAVQGPLAIEKTLSVLSPAQADAVSTLTSFECVDVDTWFFARTGYTGEDGLEIMLPNEAVHLLWSALLEAGVQPCGLAARDTLRLEAGLLLYGQDMNQHTTPLESGLEWTVQWEPSERDFIGKGALLAQKKQGLKQKLVGLTLQDKGVMRTGQRVLIEGYDDGIITSGTFSPSLNQSIALASVPIETGTHVFIDIRGKQLPALVGKPRFIKRTIQ